MKILLIHSDFIEWEPKKKAIKSAEDAPKKPIKINNALVVFSAVEKNDSKNMELCIKNTVNEILSVYNQVNPKAIVLYPYSHLSPNLSTPDVGLKVMKGLEQELRNKKYKVLRAPFGWYKAFNIKCKGHPLSELSRDIILEEKGEEVSEALKQEEKLKSEWFILEPDGKTHKIEIKDGEIRGYNFSKHKNLEKLARYEMAKSRLVKEEPPHIKLMKRLELVDHEPGTDPGNLRYYPKGKMIKALIEEWVNNKVLEYGAMEVETPIMYDYEHPSLKKYLHRFPARQYTIHTPNKKVFLRFSACFGQFLEAHDANISYRNLPLRMYEMTRYSFRVEQRGELAGLRRLRAFTMPDTHALCKDMPQAKEEFMKRFDLSVDIQKGFDLGKNDLELAVRSVKDFYKNNKIHVLNLVKKWGKPALFEVWDKKFFYFVFKYELNFVDALEKAAALTTDQIYVENAERYGIQFTDSDNKKKYPLILHCSPSGAIERVMYALLEKAHMESKKGKNFVFPLWLCPTQVRLCPISDKFLGFANKIADELERESIRVDVDDRIESIQRKIRDSETEWNPMTVVIGEKEKASGKLAVRFRENGKVEQMKPKEIIQYVKQSVKDKPYRPLPLPRLLTKRATFVG